MQNDKSHGYQVCDIGAQGYSRPNCTFSSYQSLPKKISWKNLHCKVMGHCKWTGSGSQHYLYCICSPNLGQPNCSRMSLRRDLRSPFPTANQRIVPLREIPMEMMTGTQLEMLIEKRFEMLIEKRLEKLLELLIGILTEMSTEMMK